MMSRNNVVPKPKAKPEGNACQFISGPGIDRAVRAEDLAKDYQLTLCTEHNLYHSWIDPTNYNTHNDIRRKSELVRTLGYTRRPDGRYVPSDKKVVQE